MEFEAGGKATKPLAPPYTKTFPLPPCWWRSKGGNERDGDREMKGEGIHRKKKKKKTPHSNDKAECYCDFASDEKDDLHDHDEDF